MAMLMAACSSFPSASGRLASTDPTLASIDSLLWTQPDSAFAQLKAFAESHEVDSLNNFNGHYFHLLLSELLYKNDYAQTNRDELLQAVDYYDSLVAEGGSRVDADLVFLDARAHYIYGVGYYEMDSAVQACREYLRAVELMEERFSEKDLTGEKAQFMALAYTHLTVAFSDQYLHEQAINLGENAVFYYKKHNSTSWHISWMFEEMGAHYDMMEQVDSALLYYQKAEMALDDTSGLMFRDIMAHMAFLSYRHGDDSQEALNQLKQLLLSAESDAEYASRCLSLGELFYNECLFDSTMYYMNEVYHGTCGIDSKLLAAKRLLELNVTKEDKELTDELTLFLTKNTVAVDQRGETVAKMTDLFQAFQQKKEEKAHRQKVERIKKMVIVSMGILSCLLLALLIANRIRHKREKSMETRLNEERTAFKIQQAALSGRLRKSNDKIKKMEKTIGEQTAIGLLGDNPYGNATTQYFEEPICQQILKICDDNNIKSAVSIKAYADISLSYSQIAQLNDAALKHYGRLFMMLEKNYSPLKGKDLTYCQLCLLGLNNVQIAALLQKTPSTITSQKKRLQRIFHQNNEISVVLNGFLNNL